MTINEIADLVAGELSGDGTATITGAADLRHAENGQLAFIETGVDIQETGASCVIVSNDFVGSIDVPLIRVSNPKLAFALAAEALHPRKRREAEIHPTALIGNDCTIGDGVYIGPYSVVGDRTAIGNGTQIVANVHIGESVDIGSDSVVHSNVFVESGSTIGSNVILHPGVVIGADGFGYVRDRERYVKFPQIGTVVVEDDVEIGANTCVDRGALGETRIGAGTKIDNLVQIAHNVVIGKRVVIASQTGISGSTVIEDDCVIGGQVGMGDHARVKSGAVIGSQAGVLPGKIVRQGVWWGTPVQPLDEYKRQNAHVKAISRMRDEIKELKAKIGQLASEND